MLYVRLLTKFAEIPDLIMMCADEIGGSSGDALLDSPFFSDTIKMMIDKQARRVKKSTELPVTDKVIQELAAPLMNDD